MVLDVIHEMAQFSILSAGEMLTDCRIACLAEIAEICHALHWGTLACCDDWPHDKGAGGTCHGSSIRYSTIPTETGA